MLSIESESMAASVAHLQASFGPAPAVAVVLGSGWSGVVGQLQDTKSISYDHLPAFVPSTVEGHVSEVVVGQAGTQRVVMLRGRSHTYETGDCAAMAGALRSLKAWGVVSIILTNAAGSLRSAMPPGSLMLITDHINAPQRSPLVGVADSSSFVDMANAYDPGLLALAQKIAHRKALTLHTGTFLWAIGPQFETPAEVRLFAAWGADAVGMSTVPETILARHAGLQVLGLSFITNMAAGLSSEALTHAATLQNVKNYGDVAGQFLTDLIAHWPAH